MKYEIAIGIVLGLTAYQILVKTFAVVLFKSFASVALKNSPKLRRKLKWRLRGLLLKLEKEEVKTKSLEQIILDTIEEDKGAISAGDFHVETKLDKLIRINTLEFILSQKES